MKRIFTILSIALVCGCLSCPCADAQARARNTGNNRGTQQSAPSRNSNTGSTPKNDRPVNTGRPGGSVQGSRPGGSVNNTQATRPGNNKGHGSATAADPAQQRPNNGGNSRPGSNGHQPANQPGHQPVGPGNNFGPGHGNNFGPGHGPGNNFGPGHGPGNHHPGGIGHIPAVAPNRPMLPPPRPYARPVPPPAFRPGPKYPVISTILGVTLGTAINLSLDYLYNNGYYITGYTNNAVYLNDVRQLNMLWPNATLYYNGGRLAGSEFVYSTPYYDTNRYFSAYNALTGAYGMPITNNSLPGGGFESTWFGYNGQYVTLQFMPAIAANGSSRFYTTLSFGN